jgi:succinoglycan biosynthesis protein ExoA
MTAKEPVEVSVVVPVRNEERHLQDTFAAIRAQRCDAPVEFLFVEGRSHDGTRPLLEELARADPRMRVLDNPSGTVPCALNVGLRQARGEFVVRFDAHTHYSPDYLAVGIERLRRGDVEWVSGPLVPHGVGRWSRRVALALRSWFGSGGASFRRIAAQELDVPSGFGGVWLRETLESLGGWDEGFPVNEDAEMAARVRGAGGRIVCLPRLAARYVPRDSLPALFRQYWRYGHYRVKTVRRHPGSLRRSHLLAPALTLAAIAGAVGPRPVRRSSRAGLALYAVAVVTASAGAARHGHARDATTVPVIFVVMHTGWGLGFLAGCIRFGPPLEAFARALGRRPADAAALTP